MMGPLRTIALAMALLAPATASAAGDPFFGVWRLNKAKSTIGRDPGVKSKEIVFAPVGDGGMITETVEMQSGGDKMVSHLVYVPGKFVPQDRTDLDAFAVTKSGPRRMFWTAQLKGKPLARLQVDMSADGKQLTFRYLSAASDPTGKVTADRYVYERQ